MSYYEITKTKPYSVLKDTVNIFQGTSAECKDRILFLTKPGDRVTLGTAINWINQPIEEVRKYYIQMANACGVPVDEYGRIQ